MTKRRHDIWDNNSVFEFDKTTGNHEKHLHAVESAVLDPGLAEGLDLEPDAQLGSEAHEAISKLFNKTNKRTTHMRGVRRRDAWQ